MAEGDFDTEGLVRNNLARMRLAAVTVLELIEDMWTCKDETAFLVRKRAVELARLVGQHRILPSDDEFVLKRLFDPGRGTPGRTSGVTKRWLDTVVRFRSRADLSKPVRYAVGRVIFDFADFAGRIGELRRSYVKMLDDYKAAILRAAGLVGFGLKNKLTGEGANAVNTYFKSDLWKETYINLYAKVLRMKPLEHDTAMQFHRRMEIPCEFSSTILRQALCDGYRYDRNANDALDEAHLRYLCDDSLCFVTNDEKLRKKISESSRSRVINVSGFRTVLTA